ncbi:InlB B-repeat-containing protein [Thermomonas flagellata]|uniref:InlB B-repeat-containing protein n=1 Tax=Thermomonas flagellata TaxID=2888524 RepID=UPI001F04C94F|nr:right-handed parallel beta-helix repeat-containing protein [Thermomonas flagellata]
MRLRLPVLAVLPADPSIAQALPRLLPALLLLLLSACGGGGGGSGSGSQPTPPPPTPTRHALNVSLSGSGKVTSSPAGIDCGSTCSATFDAGTQVTLTASPASGQTFTGWSGDCSGSATACTVAMTQARSVGAAFAPARYALNVSLSGSGKVTSSPAGIDCGSACSASFDAGTSVTLTATPASGQVFTGWSGDCSGSAPSCAVNMAQARSVGASFAAAPGGSDYVVFGVRVPWKVWQPGNVTTPASTTGKTYYVAVDGNDGNNGTSPSTPFATFAKAVSVVQAGDTVLIKAGTYHQVLNVLNIAGGQPGKPITFGAYGDGPVVIDASPVIPAGSWTQVGGSVWRAPLSKTLDGNAMAPTCVTDPVSGNVTNSGNCQPMAIVVNDRALRPAPNNSASAVTPGSGLWAYVAGVLTVDFGSSSPAAADLVIASQSNPSPIYWYAQSNLVFNGLTARGSGAGGIWGYGSNITVSNCVSHYNIKGGINFFGASGIPNTGNQALYNLVRMNALHNWPRGNNGFAAAGGGWSGGLVFTSAYQGLARGNVVIGNGGEGIISYGSAPGLQAGSVVFEQNLSMDNWSAAMYFDNQPGGSARQNILYFSGYDPATWFQPYSGSYPWNTLYKFNTGLAIGDECGSSGANPCSANLANTQLVNNLIVGFRIGIQEYWEGNAMTQNPTAQQHGLKNVLIANNTIILPRTTPPGTYVIGLYLWNNATPGGGNPNTNSFVQNNLIVGWDNTEPVIWYQGSGADPGVTVNNNAYWNPGFANAFNLGFNTVSKLTFAQWQQATGNDAAGLFADPGLANLGALVNPNYPNGPLPAPFDYRNAIPATGSAVLGRGMNLSGFNAIPGMAFSTNLAGQPRGASWSIGAL